ncbi:cation diffusion facilitator family transporter [Sessilibacter corallicola]|uniref:Cation diffusion facilitator family transporter n=1 Tax=Sessilibacter corallicola TaxID=2904075 RepID=A0ABQ0A686_9GAMM|nr:cation transporter [Sessilibacter corallicola]MCE2027818.1 cation transporter [Sessilibacter corallicola]
MDELKVIKVSIFAALLYALVGIVSGVISSSGVILFDGVYSLLSVLLSTLSLVVLKLIASEKEDENFPFGKAHFEPLVIVVKSITLAAICTFSASEAFSVLISGGKDVAATPAIFYALFSTVGCAIVTVYIDRKNRDKQSSLLQAERDQWYGDTLLSAGVLVGFLAAFFFRGTQLDWMVPYADPAMVIVVCCFFLIFPIRSFWGAIREILHYKVCEESTQPIRGEVEKIADELDAEFKLRMVSQGPQLDIEVNILLEDRSFSIEEMDTIRSRIAKAAESINKNHWININLTGEKAWL